MVSRAPVTNSLAENAGSIEPCLRWRLCLPSAGHSHFVARLSGREANLLVFPVAKYDAVAWSVRNAETGRCAKVMGQATIISWTHHTWNPWRGCTKISPGCKNCYMFTAQERYGND